MNRSDLDFSKRARESPAPDTHYGSNRLARLWNNESGTLWD